MAAEDRAVGDAVAAEGRTSPRAGRAGRGADPAAAVNAPPSLSTNRIARLKRYDIKLWQSALGKLDARQLAVAGKADLETLKATIQFNLAALETDTAKIADLMPLVPFAPAIVKLNETRIRMEDVNSQQAAGVLTELTKEVARVRARVEAGLNGARERRCAEGEQGLGDPRRGLGRRAPQQRHDVVQFLQRLRPALHVVDGHALQAGR